MPRTIESILASHDEARSRRASGKPVWDSKVIGVRAIIQDDHLSVEQTAEAVADRIARSRWFRDAGDDDELRLAVDELRDSEDAEHFNLVMDAIYDLADADRVWIE